MIKCKDKCDGCGKFDFLKGYNNMCLCPDCISKLEQKNKPIEKIDNFIQLTIYDMKQK